MLVFACCIWICTLSGTALAYETNLEDNKQISDEQLDTIYVPISDTEKLVFPSQKDYELYLKHQDLLSESSDQVSPMYARDELISQEKLYMFFVGYHSHTPSWTKASSHTLVSGTTSSVSTSYTYDSITFSLTLTKTVGVNTTIPADSTRYSKLGLYGDFNLKHMRTNFFDNSGVYLTYDFVDVETLDSYIDVVYLDEVND